MRRSFAFGLLILSASLAQASESSYLFVWAADADGNDSDFLAVVDAAPDSATYGKVLTTVEARRVVAWCAERRITPNIVCQRMDNFFLTASNPGAAL